MGVFVSHNQLNLLLYLRVVCAVGDLRVAAAVVVGVVGVPVEAPLLHQLPSSR